MVTAKPVRTDLGKCGGAQQGAALQPGLSTGRELHWHLGWAVWPTGASVKAGDDQMERLLLTVWEAAERT
jgi:hypothetical protein